MNNYFINDNLEIENLPKYQGAHYQKIAKEKLIVKYLSAATFYLVVIITYIVLNTLTSDKNNYHLYVFLSLFVFIILHSIFIYHSFNNQFYALRSKDIISKKGVFVKSITIIPFNRIQHIVMDQGIYSRWFGIVNLELYTSGGNDLVINGLYKNDAQKIKEYISNSINNEVENPKIKIEEEKPKLAQDE
ncbi:MAG: PH domain-containing protein [Flavobacterium sp.]